MELRISNLSKTYGNGVVALDNISLTIPTGMFGLLGPNGAGKSTLMRTLATLQEADCRQRCASATSTCCATRTPCAGCSATCRRTSASIRRCRAYELLDHFARLKGISDRGARGARRSTALLQQTNLYDVRKKRLGGFSGGMRQRFGIAQALLGDPKLIIVDEPTAGLDPEERVRFHNLLAEIGEDVIVILSTHIVDDVADLCANMAIINKGRVLLCGPTAGADRRGQRQDLGPLHRQARPAIVPAAPPGDLVAPAVGPHPDPRLQRKRSRRRLRGGSSATSRMSTSPPSPAATRPPPPATKAAACSPSPFLKRASASSCCRPGSTSSGSCRCRCCGWPPPAASSSKPRSPSAAWRSIRRAR